MNLIRASNANELYRQALSLVMSEGAYVSPRGLETREVLFTTLELFDPRSRCIDIVGRHWSLPLALGEFCWHASASDDLSHIAWYVQKWNAIVTGQKVAGSCYGKRVFASANAMPAQWSKVRQLLLQDGDTRRAILYFHDSPSESLSVNAPDLPCASTMQFFQRDGVLHAMTYMRSNDVFLGLPYDVFLFTMMHELMASELGLRLGVYQHVTGSLHLYRTDEEACAQLESEGVQPSVAMPSMEAPEQLPAFLEAEKTLREGRSSQVVSTLSPYWHELARVLAWHQGRRLGIADPFALMGRPTTPLYRRLLQSAPTVPLPTRRCESVN